MALARKTSRNRPKQRLWEYKMAKKAEREKIEKDEQRYNDLCGPVTITKINQ